MGNPVVRLAVVLIILAALIIGLVVGGAVTFAGFSESCRRVDALQNEYSFALSRRDTEATLEGVLMYGEEPRVFQPEVMSASIRHDYESAKRRCEEM